MSILTKLSIFTNLHVHTVVIYIDILSNYCSLKLICLLLRLESVKFLDEISCFIYAHQVLWIVMNMQASLLILYCCKFFGFYLIKICKFQKHANISISKGVTIPASISPQISCRYLSWLLKLNKWGWICWCFWHNKENPLIVFIPSITLIIDFSERSGLGRKNFGCCSSHGRWEIFRQC